MKRMITAREANQHLSQYLHQVMEGKGFVITMHGKPVACLVPANKSVDPHTVEQRVAWKDLKSAMKKGYDLGGKKFNREDIYDRWKG